MVIEFVGNTDVGLIRQNNEDNFANLVIDLVTGKVQIVESHEVELLKNRTVAAFIIADGMGGAAAGEVASQLAIDTAVKNFTERHLPINREEDIVDYLKAIVIESHQVILSHAKKNPESFGMGTTVTIGLAYNDQLFIVWSGDSRIYRYAPHGVEQMKSYDLEQLEILTPDHSVVWEMVERGEITSEDARTHEQSNIITQSLGDPTFPPKPDFRIINLFKGDRILLCSDGLNGMMADFYISQILGSGLGVRETVSTLTDAAKSGGGTDNITVTVVEVKEGVAPMIIPTTSITSVITKKSEHTFSTNNTAEAIVKDISSNDEFKSIANTIDKEENNIDEKKESKISLKPLLISVFVLLSLVFAAFKGWENFTKKPSTSQDNTEHNTKDTLTVKGGEVSQSKDQDSIANKKEKKPTSTQKNENGKRNNNKENSSSSRSNHSTQESHSSTVENKKPQVQTPSSSEKPVEQPKKKEEKISPELEKILEDIKGQLKEIDLLISTIKSKDKEEVNKIIEEQEKVAINEPAKDSFENIIESTAFKGDIKTLEESKKKLQKLLDNLTNEPQIDKKSEVDKIIERIKLIKEAYNNSEK